MQWDPGSPNKKHPAALLLSQDDYMGEGSVCKLSLSQNHRRVITVYKSLQYQSFVFGKERPSWDAANSPILFDLHLRRILQELGLAFSLLFGILILFSYSIRR